MDPDLARKYRNAQRMSNVGCQITVIGLLLIAALIGGTLMGECAAGPMP